MWVWGVLLAVFAVITFFMPWAQRAAISALQADVETLKRKISNLEGGGINAQARPVIPAQAAPASPRAAPPPAPAPAPARGDNSADYTPFPWLRENWLLAIGSVFMILAAGWLVRYSILHGLVGPAGRVIGGLTLGVGIIGLAQHRIRTHLNQGSIFAALGTVIVLLTIFGGRKYYGMFSAESAMVFMLMTVALAAFISVFHRAERLSYAVVLMAGAVPLLVSTGTNDFVGLFSYLAVVTAGTLWVVFLTGWRKNILAALAVVFLYSLPALQSHHAWLKDPWTGLAFAYGFALVFFCTTLFSGFRGDRREKMPDLATAALLGIFIVAWTVRVMPEEWRSLSLAAWTVVFSTASYALFARAANAQFFYVYSGVSTLLLVAATAVEFSGPALTLAFIAEAALLPLLTWRALGDARKAAAASLFTILPAFLSFSSLPRRAWPEGKILHADFFVVLSMTAVLAWLAFFLFHIRKKSAAPAADGAGLPAVFSGAATYYAGHLVWRTLHAALRDDDAATTLSLSLFMLAGIGSYFAGHRRGAKLLRLYGGLIIGWVSFRLLFIDMPQMDAGGKVVTFFVLGALLLGTAFLERRKKGASK